MELIGKVDGQAMSCLYWGGMFLVSIDWISLSIPASKIRLRKCFILFMLESVRTRVTSFPSIFSPSPASVYF